MQVANTSLSPRSPNFWLNLLTTATTGAVISIFFQKNYGSCGDYPQHFATCAWGAGSGLAVGLAYNLLYLRIPNARLLRPVLTVFLRFYLAWIILVYAVVKIIPVQFPYLLANMDSTFAELPPMRIAWTFFGYSKGYQMLLGWAEAIPALLLVFRRTYLPGALLLTLVLINVVAVNVCFGVCVILNSSIYLAVAIVLLIGQYDRLWTFFFTDKPTPPQTPPEALANPAVRRAAQVLHALLFLGVIAGTLYFGWQAWKRYQKQEAYSPVNGVWRTTSLKRLHDDDTWLPVPTSDSAYIERIYLQGEHGVLKGPGRRDRVILAQDTSAHTLRVTFLTAGNERPLVHAWQYRMPARDTLLLVGREWKDSVRLELFLDKSFFRNN